MSRVDVIEKVQLRVKRGEKNDIEGVMVELPCETGGVKVEVSLGLIRDLRPGIEKVFEKIDDEDIPAVTAGWEFPFENDFAKKSFKKNGIRQTDRLRMAFLGQKRFRTAVDVGAHIGTWSVLMASVFEKVHAFEPLPETYFCLKRNLNNRGLENVFTHWTALGDRSGLTDMSVDSQSDGYFNSYAAHVVEGNKFPMEKLDAFGLENVDFLKIDVEGTEADVLRGAEETIMRDRPVIFLERKRNKEAIDEMMEKLNYRKICAFDYDSYYRPN